MFGEGIGIMRPLALRDLYKTCYKVSPADLQWYITVMQLPTSFRFVTGLFVDLKLVDKRKYLLVFFASIQLVSQFSIFMRWVNTPRTVLMVYVTTQIANTFMSSVIASLLVQQARANKNGQ